MTDHGATSEDEKGNRPHIVSVVGNDIIIDSRVKRVAATAAAAGFRSTLICYTADREGGESRMGDVTVIRVPVPFTVMRAKGRVPLPLRPVVGTELAQRHLAPRIKHLARKRRLTAALTEKQPGSAGWRRTWLALQLLRVRMKIRQDAYRLRSRAHVTWDRLKRLTILTRVRLRNRLLRQFKNPVRAIADYEVAFGPLIEELKPDLIHAHDYHMGGIAMTAARHLRASGVDTKVIYDAHELVEGISYPPRVIRGWLAEESSYVHAVDAVLAVSPDQATRIQARYRLAEAPVVVMNAPVVRGRSHPERTVRDDAKVDGSILVYHGKVDRARGLYVLVEALEFLPADVHIVVLANTETAVTRELTEIAASLGAGDRLHILGFVPAEQLPDYLATADIAVAPFLIYGNADVSLPNKLFEAIHAGLPMLTSNTKSLSAFVEKHQIGKVFEAGSSRDLAQKAVELLDEIDEITPRFTPELRTLASWDDQADRLIATYNRLLGLPVSAPVQLRVQDIVEDRRASAPTSRPTRVAIGPRNSAGQAYMIANAIQTHLGVPAFSFAVGDSVYEFPIHQQISGAEWRDPAWQLQQRRSLATGFTHVLAESGTGVIGAMNGGFIDEQAAALAEDGLRVAILLHGSEIRDPRRHVELPHSPYAVDDELTRALEQATTKLRRHLANIDLPVFVTTPDLLADIEATWLPVVIDVPRWSALEEAFNNPIPTVLHLPSRSRLKGSEYVDPVLGRLQEEGEIRYLRPENRVDASEVMTLVEQADIIIDGIVIGAYGVMSCQALAAGRLAIGNLSELGPLGAECPIVNADPGTLDAVLRGLLADRESWKERSETGREFVGTYHSGAFTAQTLKPFLDLV